jgi:hypothetical protein
VPRCLVSAVPGKTPAMGAGKWITATTTVVLGTVLAAAGVAGCGGDDGSDDEAGSDVAAADLQGPFPLPFGFEQVEGTEPIGRPASYEEAAYHLNGEPVRSRTLQAAYRVTADDPTAVLRDWADQLDQGLALDNVFITYESDGSGGPWLTATGDTEYRSDEPADYADLQLWATEAGPILLVSVSRVSDEPPRNATVEEMPGDPAAPDPVPDDSERSAGDVLFTEQSNEIHLPEGTRTLMPTIPTFGGTGGSSSVLAAEDGEATVRALLDEALEVDADGDATEPEVTEVEGTEIVTGGYVREAGGWGFDVVSIRGPDDPAATVYVTSYAD